MPHVRLRDSGNRKIFRFLGIYVCLQLLAAASVFGQQDSDEPSLNQKLSQEDPVALAQQAREKGDVVRGAILFHQGNIQCAKCHQPANAAERIGPDLRQPAADMTDAHVVRSILQPSEVIHKDYKTVNVLQTDGRMVSGIVLRESDSQLTIQDRLDLNRRLTIERENIDTMQPSDVSSMPADLANQLKNRQQFLDLVRYVLDLQQQGPRSVTPAVAVPSRSLSDRQRGHVLLAQHNCQACHQWETTVPPLSPKRAPRLKWAAQHLNPDYLVDFIANPQATKPGTSMPRVLRQQADDQRTEMATALVHFLVSQVDSQDYQAPKTDREAARAGHELFQSVGCVACHSPRSDSNQETGLADSVALGDLTNKYSLQALTEFLLDPLVNRPSGHMPQMKLSYQEATQLSHFLLQSPEPEETQPWEVDSQLAQQGAAHFQQLRCAACHDDIASGGNQDKIVLVNLENGCLADTPGDWPEFNWNDQERKQLAVALDNAQPFNIKEQIENTMANYRCQNCHSRDGWGGVSDERNPHFQTVNLNLGEQGRIPPALTGVGAKLKAPWLRDVLVNGRTVRPYMNTRMPQFGKEQVESLVPLLKQVDQLEPITYAPVDDAKAMREAGLNLAGNQGLNCVACHTWKFEGADTMPAADMTEMAERLEKRWFYHYMLDPQSLSPNTVMPSFWPNGRAIRSDLEGTPEQQIESLWEFLLDGRQARTPRGVVRERLEIAVDQEAQMLRRQYPEIGKRGIGVGYPGGINLAFDAEQMRLGLIWKGGFADPGGVWTGQGSGNVRPLGRPLVFPRGPDVDLTDSPWTVDEGRPPQHQFLGYRLDEQRRPIFRYRIDGVTIEDYFTQVKDQDSLHLRRVLSVPAPTEHDPFRVRLTVAAKIQVSPDNARTFLTDQGLTVHLHSDHQAQVVPHSDGQQLQLTFPVTPETAQPLVVEYRWN